MSDSTSGNACFCILYFNAHASQMNIMHYIGYLSLILLKMIRLLSKRLTALVKMLVLLFFFTFMLKLFNFIYIFLY